jgi:hypothetical protein
MARLEDAKFVRGWYLQKIVDGQIIKERRYRVLAPGLRAWQRTRDFYFATEGQPHGALLE